MITIIANEANTNEYKEWLALSQQGLESAYGNDEPEYSQVLIKEPNVEALQKAKLVHRSKRLADAAKLMQAEYQTNKELICFTSLDGEPVYE